MEECEVASPTQYFFYRETLNVSSSIDENGGVHMGLALCLLLAWVIVFLFIVRGVKSTGMVKSKRIHTIHFNTDPLCFQFEREEI